MFAYNPVMTVQTNLVNIVCEWDGEAGVRPKLGYIWTLCDTSDWSKYCWGIRALWQATWAHPRGLNVHTQIKSSWGGTKDSWRCREMRWCKRNNLALTGPLQTARHRGVGESSRGEWEGWCDNSWEEEGIEKDGKWDERGGESQRLDVQKSLPLSSWYSYSLVRNAGHGFDPRDRLFSVFILRTKTRL